MFATAEELNDDLMLTLVRNGYPEHVIQGGATAVGEAEREDEHRMLLVCALTVYKKWYLVGCFVRMVVGWLRLENERRARHFWGDQADHL